MNHKKTSLSFLFVLVLFLSLAQEKTLSVEDQLAQIEMEMDSLSIFILIDSILKYEPKIYSELILRASYNSNVLSAGRNLGVNQHGFSPGVSFYHKTGAFADLSGFWNSAFDPKYNLTIASIGYMKLLGKQWNLTGSYERWLYNISSTDSTTSPSLKNSTNISGGFNSKYLFASLDYNYLFGSKDAHRIIGNLSGNITFKNVWFFDKIRIIPSMNLIYGNSEVYTYYFTDSIQKLNQIKKIVNTTAFESFLQSVDFTMNEERQLERIENNPRLSDEAKKNRKNIVYSGNSQVIEYLDNELSSTKDKYGIMNYSLSLPVMFTIKHFTGILSYTYSIPIDLPGEHSGAEPTGYFGASLTYRIPFR